MTENELADILRKHGHKQTPQRNAVLRVIAASHDHLTPEAIYERVHLKSPDIGLVTVYRTLNLLSELNLVCRIHTPNGCRGYMMRRPVGHHHHLVCSDCGRTVAFTDCSLGELEQKLSKKTGFSIDGHLLELHGRCQNCREIAKVEG